MTQHPELFPPHARSRYAGGKRFDLGDSYFRSSWEANWARYLNWLISINEVVSWEYEKHSFEFKDVKKGGRYYLPDFKVFWANGEEEFHEVKGYMDARSQYKLMMMKKHFPQVSLVLVDRDYYRDVANRIGKRLPMWETQSP